MTSWHLVAGLLWLALGAACLIKRTKTFSLPLGIVAITIGAGIILTPLFR
jgi:hypothetical protein